MCTIENKSHNKKIKDVQFLFVLKLLLKIDRNTVSSLGATPSLVVIKFFLNFVIEWHYDLSREKQAFKSKLNRSIIIIGSPKFKFKFSSLLHRSSKETMDGCKHKCRQTK